MWSEVVCERSGNTASVDKMSMIGNSREREYIQTSSVLYFLPKGYRTCPERIAGVRMARGSFDYDRLVCVGATESSAGFLVAAGLWVKHQLPARLLFVNAHIPSDAGQAQPLVS